MPYIKQEKRSGLDEVVNLMSEKGIKADGDLNYVLFAYCLRNTEPSYNNYKNYIAELNECSEEIRRRILAPYENKKIRENGDVSR